MFDLFIGPALRSSPAHMATLHTKVTDEVANIIVEVNKKRQQREAVCNTKGRHNIIAIHGFSQIYPYQAVNATD